MKLLKNLLLILMLAAKKVREIFERTKPHCNIGTIGHVDHGKTTLTAAITKVLAKIGKNQFYSYADIDSNIDEKERGITINASHVEYETDARHYSHIDCPGHQQYIKNMLTGAIQMEGAILVVAVNDGPQVQTREHIILSREIGIKYIVVFINKLDAITEPDLKVLVELEIRELLETYGYPTDLPVIQGSARTALEETEETELGTGAVKLLMKTVDTYIPQPDRLLDAPFLLSIENAFSITGRGTVVTGKIEQGTLSENDNLELLGKSVVETTCLGIEMFQKLLSKAIVGDNVGILVKGIKKDNVKKGNILATPKTMQIYDKFEAKTYILTKAEGGRHKSFVNNYKPQFFFRTASLTGSIILPEDITYVMPGDSPAFNVNLVEKAPLNIGLRFVMREGILTVGAGVITKLL